MHKYWPTGFEKFHPFSFISSFGNTGNRITWWMTWFLHTKRTPQRCLPQKHQTIWQAFNTIAQNCVRNSGVFTELERCSQSSSREGSVSWGLYQAVPQGEYIWKNRGLKGRVGARSGPDRLYLKPSAPPADTEVLLPPLGLWHSGPLSSLTLERHLFQRFPVSAHEGRHTFSFLKVTCQHWCPTAVWERMEMNLCGIVRMSVKKKMKAELEMSYASFGTHVSAKVFLVNPPPPASFPPYFPPGGHESEAGQQPEEESQRDRNTAFGAAWSQTGSHLR